MQLRDELVIEEGRTEVCSTCYSNILQGKTPLLAVGNGFSYPVVPPELAERPLTAVAQHVLAPRLPFMQIMHLGRLGKRGQYGVKGSVINVPADPQQTLRKLIPLLPEEDLLCVVNLYRKLSHKRPYATSFVDRETLLRWGCFLSQTELYKKYEIQFDESRLDQEQWDGCEQPEVCNETDDPATREEAMDRLGKIMFTVLMEDRVTTAPTFPAPEPVDPADPSTDEINVAPGEDRQPISVLWDKEAEELSFPGVFLGQPRRFKEGLKVTRYHMLKSEVARFDRRGAEPITLLYKMLVHLRYQSVSRLHHSFKRSAVQASGTAITRSQLQDPAFTASYQMKGLAVPNILPNSAGYWKTVGHDVMAMLRQLGRPHIFFTLSAAEYHWPILLTTLRKLHRTRGHLPQDGNPLHGEPGGAVRPEFMEEVDRVVEDLSSDRDIPSAEKLELIQQDPIVTAMYFREIVLQIKKWMRRADGPMGRYRVKDFLFRIEFQARGSPHLHCLWWVENGPEDPLRDKEAAVRMVDELISCNYEEPLAVRVQHKHTTTCFRKESTRRMFRMKKLPPEQAHRYCRFDIPYFPSPFTMILEPLFKDVDERQVDAEIAGEDWEACYQRLKALRLRLKDTLASEDCPETLEEVWARAGCRDEREYHLAIRSGIKRPMVLYRRKVSDRFTNPHILWVLRVIGSNTDGQLILDTYSLVRYCVSYVTKVEKAHSHLYNCIADLQRQGFQGQTLQKMIASQALRARETSAQEAAWVLLQYPLSEKSRICRYIDTSLPDQRVRSPKTQKELEKLPANSTDIWRPDIYEAYAARDEFLEPVSLADYVARFVRCERKDEQGRPLGRLKPWVIRYRGFKEKSDDVEVQENFYRAMCTLHVPWRDEEGDILRHGRDGGSYRALFDLNADLITEGRRMFESSLDVEELEDEVHACVAEDNDDEFDEAFDRARHRVAGASKFVFEEHDVAEFMDAGGQNIDMDMPGTVRHRQTNQSSVALRRRHGWNLGGEGDTYLQDIRQLNPEQRQIVLAIIDGLRLKLPPKLLFIDGPAGTGKSMAGRCIIKAFETFAPDLVHGQPKIVVSAFTGMAASHIDGGTINSVYHIPPNQEKTVKGRVRRGDRDVLTQKDHEELARLQNEFSNIHGQLIDEISMVSDSHFLGIDQRCREAKGNEDIFGGLWTICMGDFRQLRPVAASPVYEGDVYTGSAALWREFEYVEFTQNMRQGEDRTFADILAKIGTASDDLTVDERKLIESRFVRQNNLVAPDNAIRLYKNNFTVDDYNRKQIMKQPEGKIIHLPARDRVEVVDRLTLQMEGGRAHRTTESVESLLHRAMGLPPKDTKGLRFELYAVVGLPYMLTINLRQPDGLVNGAIGELTWVELGTVRQVGGIHGHQIEVKTLWFRYPGKIGTMTSKESRGRLQAAIDASERYRHLELDFDFPEPPPPSERDGLVPIDRLDRELPVGHRSCRKVMRQQFPKTPAKAITICKSQGSSHKTACVGYSQGLENCEVYVAFSRVTTLGGLFIETDFPTKDGRRRPPADLKGQLFKHPTNSKRMDAVRAEWERLRTRRFVPRWNAILNAPALSYRLIYHNVQSLLAHAEDVRLDRVFMDADLLLFTETKLTDGDAAVDLGDGMRQVARCDRVSEHRGGGVVALSRVPPSLLRPVPLPRFSDIEVCCVQATIGLRVAVMYCRSGVPVHAILQAAESTLLQGTETILCGDFNVNMRTTEAGVFESSAGKTFVEGLRSIGLHSHINLTDATTYGQTTIDGVFSNMTDELTLSGLRVERYQSYFSHHLPLVVFLPTHLYI